MFDLTVFSKQLQVNISTLCNSIVQNENNGAMEYWLLKNRLIDSEIGDFLKNPIEMKKTLKQRKYEGKEV